MAPQVPYTRMHSGNATQGEGLRAIGVSM